MARFNLKKAAVAAAAAFACVGGKAGFMDDFYTAAGASANVTAAQTVKTQGGTFMTGGSVVWRVPQRTFQPFNFQAPSIKAGCGGIDVFAGSFGFANSAEFVNYLRNIGQNAVGLFFRLALKSFAPQLETVIGQISDDIQRMNAMMGSSCQAAAALVNATGWPEKVKAQNAGQSASTGALGGFYDGYQKFSSSLNDALNTDYGPAVEKNSGGAPVGKKEHNVTWLAINSGQISDSGRDYRNIVLSMFGTTIYKLDEHNPDTPQQQTISKRVNMEELAGRWSSPPSSLGVWNCGDDISDPCLLMGEGTVANFRPLASKAYQSMTVIRDAIMNRQDIMTVTGGPAAMTMLGATRLPVFKVIEISSSPGMIGLSEIFLQKFADLMGYELATAFINTASEELSRSLTTARRYSTTIDPNDIKHLEIQVLELKKESGEVRKKLDALHGSQADLIKEVEHLEGALWSGFNLRLMDNIKTAVAYR